MVMRPLTGADSQPQTKRPQQTDRTGPSRLGQHSPLQRLRIPSSHSSPTMASRPQEFTKVDLTPRRHHGFQVLLFILGTLVPPLGTRRGRQL